MNQDTSIYKQCQAGSKYSHQTTMLTNQISGKDKVGGRGRGKKRNTAEQQSLTTAEAKFCLLIP